MLRKTLIISYAVLFVAFAAPFVYSVLCSAQEKSRDAEQKNEQQLQAELERSIRLLDQGTSLEMDMHSYLVGVVAAEMPALFPHEALKAQAVAARTYAMYCVGLERHKNADVCSYSGCCQAWMSQDALRQRWGADYDKYSSMVSAAVKETAGEYLGYEGQPVLAAFHSSSAGATENSAQIWNATPYLISVPSPETEENLPQLISHVKVAPLDLRDTILSQYPHADMSGAPEGWLGRLSETASGRVDSLKIGAVPVPGTKLRQLFSLRSTDFRLEYDGSDFVFTVAGYGHGVGMSQYGAKLMAEAGADYRSILAHYYPQTSLLHFS